MRGLFLYGGIVSIVASHDLHSEGHRAASMAFIVVAALLLYVYDAMVGKDK